MEPYAAVEDLIARWRPLNESEKAVAETLLGDAAVFIHEQLPCGYDESLHIDALKMVSCDVVKRQMLPRDSGIGSGQLSQMTQSAGPFSFTGTIANPSGDMYLTSSEKALFGIGSCEVLDVGVVIGWGS